VKPFLFPSLIFLFRCAAHHAKSREPPWALQLRSPGALPLCSSASLLVHGGPASRPVARCRR
jgi:hypothetical protein